MVHVVASSSLCSGLIVLVNYIIETERREYISKMDSHSRTPMGLDDVEEMELVDSTFEEEVEQLEMNNNKEFTSRLTSDVFKPGRGPSTLQIFAAKPHIVYRHANSNLLHPRLPKKTFQETLINRVVQQKSFPGGKRPRPEQYYQEFINDQQTALCGIVQRFNEIKSVKLEEAKLQDEIRELQRRLDKAKILQTKARQKLVISKTNGEDRRKDAIKANEKLVRKFQKLSAKEAKRLENYRISVKKISEATSANKRQTQLSELFGIKILMPQNYMEEETIMQLTKIDPKDSKAVFTIRLVSIDLESKQFLVKSVFPTYEEAYEVIITANKNQDLIKFLLECKKYWRKSLHSVSSPETDPEQIYNPDLSQPLFDSPPST